MTAPIHSADLFSRLKGASGQDTVKSAAREMEALFIYELIKVMRESGKLSDQAGLGGSIYTSMFDMEIARVMSVRGIGLQEELIKGMDKASYYAKRPGQMGKDADAPAEFLDITKIIAEDRVSSGYGPRRDPFDGTEKFHHGIDISLPEGAEIRPVRPGRVVYSGEMRGYGNVVEIEHGDGVSTLYAHNKENLVKEGDSVEAETVIARVGSTGRATGPHLHFEVRIDGGKVDPRAGLARLRI